MANLVQLFMWTNVCMNVLTAVVTMCLKIEKLMVGFLYCVFCAHNVFC